MKTIKKFFTTIKDTFYNPSFYSQIKDIDGSKPVTLVLALSFISAIVLMSGSLPAMFNFAENVDTNEIKNYFPAELEITIKEGQATSSIEGPYYFGEIPEEETLKEGDKTYAVLVDTTADYTLSQIKELDAYVVVTKDAFLGEEDNELRAYYYSDIFQDKEFTLNQSVIGGWVEQVKGWAKPIIVALYLGGVGMFSVIFSIGSFFLALLFSLMTMVIAAVKNRKMKYGQVYKTTLFGLVPVIVISLIAPGLPLWIKLVMFTIILSTNLEKSQDIAPGTQV
jgi:hypothetical protein